MQLGVLFWFYKDAAVCRNRLRLLRRHNPELPVFGLYGGPPEQADRFAETLGPLLDDFWAFTEPLDTEWKWRHGDLMLAQWFARHGVGLQFDSVFLAQWDMVVTAPLVEVLPALDRGQMLLSGLRPVREVEQWWRWTRWTKTRAEYDAFLAHVAARYGEVEDPLCCQFIGMVLPREFLARYAQIDEPELGFLEYKVPVYAQVFGTPLVPDTCFHPWWPEEPVTTPLRRGATAMHAWRNPVPLPVIVGESMRRGGRRIFHPYHGIYPHDVRSAVDVVDRRRARRLERPAAS